MAFRDLSGYAKELYLREKIKQLRAVYAAAQKHLASMANDVTLTDFSRARAEEILKQVNQIVAGLNKDAYSWAKNALPDAYNQGLDFAAERLKALNVTRFVSPTASVHTQAINVLIDDVTIDLITANNGAGKFFQRFVRQTQQAVLQDQEISRAIAQGLIEGGTRKQVSNVLLDNLRQKMKEQKFLVINGRNYRPDSYAELVARTRTREATSQAIVNTSVRYGVDLLQWDTHSEICEYCAQYAGRVYSITGTDPDFPPLVDKPPLHPNCRCVLTPTTRRNLDRQDRLDSIIKLSNSDLIRIDSASRLEQVLTAL